MSNQFLNNVDLVYLKTLSSILNKPLTFVDLETTGLVHEPNFSIIEIGLVSITPTQIIERSSLVNPEIKIPSFISNLTGITDDMVINKKTYSHFNPYFKKIADEHVLLGFNSRAFDSTGLVKMSKKNNLHYTFNNQIDARYVFIKNRNELLEVKSQKGTLEDACKFYQIQPLNGQAHRAAYDVALTVLLVEEMLKIHGLITLSPEIKKFNCNETKALFSKYLKSIYIPD